MAKYRKKPVVIEAEVYKPGMEDGFDCESKYKKGECDGCLYLEAKSCNGYMKPYINTLKGKMLISSGDYIITGVKGERYPCKPDIFEMTYEKVECE